MMGWMAPLRHLGAKVLVGREPPANREPSMNEITTVGLDLAKNVFQVHGGRCRGDDGSAQAASTGTSASILQSTTALSSWDGGVCDGALLGAGAACAGP